MDLQNRSPDYFNQFMIRGFPCKAAKDYRRFDKHSDFYAPMNDAFRHSMNACDMFNELLDRSPVDKNKMSQVVRGKSIWSCVFFCKKVELRIPEACDKVFQKLLNILMILCN